MCTQNKDKNEKSTQRQCVLCLCVFHVCLCVCPNVCVLCVDCVWCWDVVRVVGKWIWVGALPLSKYDLFIGVVVVVV